MRFRFILSHDIEGSLEISEPSGWIDSTMTLERHEEFHSLLERFNGSFIFYGNNGIVNGGIEYIKNIEQTYGLDEKITITIDVTFDEINFESVFIGQFAFADLEELMDNKMRLPIIRDDFWAKFISRLNTPVNIQSTNNEDNLPALQTEHIVLNLPSQKIRYAGDYEWGDTFTYYEEADFNGDLMFAMQLDWEIVLIDDLKKFTLPRTNFQANSSPGSVTPVGTLIGNIEAPFDGDFTFDIQLYASEYFSGPDQWFNNAAALNFYVLKTTESVQGDTNTNEFEKTIITCGSDSVTRYNFNKTYRLLRGEQVSIYGHRVTGNHNFTIFGNQRLFWMNVVVASTGPLVLSGEQTIDGIVTSISHVLVKNQLDPSENGVWVTGAGAWTRSLNADETSEINNIAVFVTLGTTNANTAWKQDNIVQTVGLDDQSWIYIIPSDERLKPFPCSFEVENYLRITADTTYPDTESEGILLHDAGAAISDRIIGENATFYSELLGSSLTRARQYDQDGCAWAYGLAKGLQVRQYTLEEKPFFMSFNQWWKGANPILNLSLRQDIIDGQPVIRVEDKADVYIDEVLINFSYVRATRKYDNERIFNKAEVGYAQWQSEDISGLDDPQTKKTYVTRFQKVGSGINLHSEFIAASLAGESARRKARTKSSDYKFDNETFIFALNPNQVDESPDSSPDILHFSPELDENFTLITNLLNPETRYNLRLTPARNFLRWQNYIQGALQAYSDSVFRVASPEGNYDMTSQMVVQSPDCLNEDYNGAVLSEKGEIPVTTDFIHLPHLYEMTIPMEWSEYKIIRDNPRNAIGISLSDADHVPMFIKTLSYKPVKGTCDLLLWAKEYLDIYVTSDVTPMQECQPSVAECENSLTDEDGNILTNELGVCITE